MDGVDPYTESPTPPGGEHVYEFVAKGPAVGIYHSHHDAQQQIPDGMFGAFLIDDIPVPKKLIDKGYPEQPTKVVNMVLNDAGVIGLSLNGKSFPATTPYTIRVGETMMVNYLNEGLTAHPMHLHQPSGLVVAKDGHVLAQPYEADTVNVAPGERITVVYTAKDKGVWAWHCHILTHAEGEQGNRLASERAFVEVEVFLPDDLGRVRPAQDRVELLFDGDKNGNHAKFYRTVWVENPRLIHVGVFPTRE